MLQLGVLAGTDLDVVDPTPQISLHVHGRGCAERQDPTCGFLCNPIPQQRLVQREDVGENTVSTPLEVILVRGMNIVEAVLAVFLVLPTEARHIRRTSLLVAG